MSLDELHTLDARNGDVHPDSDTVPGLFSLWFCQL